MGAAGALGFVFGKLITMVKPLFKLLGFMGKAVFGIDEKGPVGSPDDAEDFLRNLGPKAGGASLRVALLPRGKKRKRPAANDSVPAKSPAPAPKPTEKPRPKLRNAKPGDAARLAELIHELGHEIGEKVVRKNLAALKKTGELPIVATLEKKVVGLVGVHRMVTVHRDAPVGRIPVLVVTDEARGMDIGRMLVDAAEDWCRSKGCKLIEVTSNDRRAQAHAFYRHLGYERTSIRFFKTL